MNYKGKFKNKKQKNHNKSPKQTQYYYCTGDA